MAKSVFIQLENMKMAKLEKFQLNSITYNSNILVIGGPKTGKSVLISDILFQISPQKLTHGIYTVSCGKRRSCGGNCKSSGQSISCGQNSSCGGNCKSSSGKSTSHNIEYNFNNIRLPEEQEEQENEKTTTEKYVTRVLNRENYLDLEGKSNKKILVIDNPEMFVDESLKIVRGLGWTIDYFIQSIADVDLIHKSNIEHMDYLFIFVGRTKFRREKLFVELFDLVDHAELSDLFELFKDFDAFNAVLENYCGEHQCLVIHRMNKTSKDGRIQMFNYKADMFSFEMQMKHLQS